MSSTAIHPAVMLRVLVADGGISVNDGLTALLSEFEGLSVFGCVQEPAKILTLIAWLHPDVVILDLQMAGPVGLKTLKQIKHDPGAPIVIVLSNYDSPAIPLAVLAAGADHYLVKTECEHLQQVLRDLVRKTSMGVSS